MFKHSLIYILPLFVSASTFGFSPLDSVGVENLNGKKLIIHKVDTKETYYSLSRKYQVSVADIQKYNNNIALHPGNIVKVPTNRPFVEQKQVASANTNNQGYFEYKIVAKDNLHLLAEKFATTVDEIKKINQLSSNQLQIGQVLRIPFNKSNPLQVAEPSTKPQTTSNEAKTLVKETINLASPSISEHIVKPKEYLNLIAKQYGTTAEAIKEINGLSSNNLSIGQVLKIPVSVAASTSTGNTSTPAPSATGTQVLDNKSLETKSEQTTESTFEHTVVAGETIYSIAHKYQLTTFQLKNLNNLSTNDISIGQKLIIKGAKPLEQNSNAISQNVDDEDETIKNPNLKRPASAYGLNKIDERGTAVWIADADLDASKMLVLHRTAPIGTVIQLTNPMTNRSTFAKVVGKFTENESTKDAIIVMTKAVADALGALDKRFLCNLSYAAREDK